MVTLFKSCCVVVGHAPGTTTSFLAVVSNLPASLSCDVHCRTLVASIARLLAEAHTGRVASGAVWNTSTLASVSFSGAKCFIIHHAPSKLRSGVRPCCCRSCITPRAKHGNGFKSKWPAWNSTGTRSQDFTSLVAHQKNGLCCTVVRKAATRADHIMVKSPWICQKLETQVRAHFVVP